MIAGLVWNRWFPINKNLWTSSFVLFTGGFALMCLAFFYWILEIRNWRGAWTTPFLVFGMNAIAGFLADSFVYGPGYSFTVKAANGTTMNWHEAAQAKLMTMGLNVRNDNTKLFRQQRQALNVPLQMMDGAGGGQDS